LRLSGRFVNGRKGGSIRISQVWMAEFDLPPQGCHCQAAATEQSASKRAAGLLHFLTPPFMEQATNPKAIRRIHC
jgi:hypothetical protein